MKEIIKSIEKKEWIFVLGIAILLIIITTAPTIYGFLVKTEDKFFPALHSIGPGDYNVYYSYIEQVRGGNLLFKDIFTSEEHSPFLFNPLWLLIGLTGKFFNLSNIITFQFSRILLIFPFLFVLYLLISLFIKEKILRRLCFIFSIFASGLGSFFVSLIKYTYQNNLELEVYPMDLWVSESYNFLTLYHSAHFIMATLLIILIFLLMFLSFQKNNFHYTIWAGLLALFLFFFHPFHLPTIFFILFVYIFVASFQKWKIRWDYIKKFIVFLLISLPAIIYQFLLLIYNPVAIGRASQNTCLTTTFWVTLISYGLLTPFAIWGVIKKQKNNGYKFLLTWLIVHSLLIFSPFQFQRRLTQGLQIPLTIFAFWGLYYFYEYLKRKYSGFKLSHYYPLISLFLIIFFTFSNLYVLAQDLSFYTYSEYRNWPHYIYLDKEYGEAFFWLKNNLGDQDIVLSDTVTGSFIAGFSGKKIYIGHWVETLEWQEKLKTTKWFFREDSEDEKKIDFLRKERITYLFYSQFEDEKGDFEPRDKDFLKLVFAQGKVLIYQVL